MHLLLELLLSNSGNAGFIGQQTICSRQQAHSNITSSTLFVLHKTDGRQSLIRRIGAVVAGIKPRIQLLVAERNTGIP